VDRFRGLLNEGGLYAERQGWHLPSYDATSWTVRAISEGLPHGSSGIGVFRTEFVLKIPDGYDAPMEFVFEDAWDGESAYRALIFVNGWMMGKRVANLGYVTPRTTGVTTLMPLVVPNGASLCLKEYYIIKEATL
jgi:Beta-galactosidase jelly roll domain